MSGCPVVIIVCLGDEFMILGGTGFFGELPNPVCTWASASKSRMFCNTCTYTKTEFPLSPTPDLHISTDRCLSKTS